MLDIAFIREHPDVVRRGAERKGIRVDLNGLLALDAERRRLLRVQEETRAEQNALGAQVKTLQGDAKATTLARLSVLKAKVQEATEALKPVQERMQRLLLEVPNPPDDDAPDQDEPPLGEPHDRVLEHRLPSSRLASSGSTVGDVLRGRPRSREEGGGEGGDDGCVRVSLDREGGERVRAAVGDGCPEDAGVALHGGGGIDIDGGPHFGGDARQGDVFGVEHAVTKFKMVHRRKS